MTTRIARGGSPLILITFGITALLFFASLFSSGNWDVVFSVSFRIMFLFSLFTLFFLRDPERKAPPDPATMYAPADGTIMDIRTIEEPLYLKAKVIRISIFMSVFNVHVNRSPINGTVELMQYNKGKFISAFKEKASEDNESLFIGIQARDISEKIAVKFIAGLIARRIAFYKELNDDMRQGERINLIRFGSRVDLFCPATSIIAVKKGDTMKAGQTVMAYFTDQ